MPGKTRDGALEEDEGVVVQMYPVNAEGRKVANQGVGDGGGDQGDVGLQQEQQHPQHTAAAPRISYPARIHVPGNTKTSILNAENSHAALARGPSTTKFAPLPDSSRRQFARDSSSSLSPYARDDDHELSLPDSKKQLHGGGQYGRPSSTDSLPLQRIKSHGRASVLEMDLADEPMSAYEQAAPSMHEQARRKRHGHHPSRRRRRTPSIASKQTKRTVRSRAGKAIERMRRRRDSSSSSSSSSGSSSSSSSSGIDWRFWRSSTASSVTDDGYIPPEPTFTLYTPRIASELKDSSLPSEKDLHNLGKDHSIPHPYTSKSSEKRDRFAAPGGQPGIPPPATAQVFDVLLSRTLNPCLDRLKEFWQERDQTEGLGGDLGAAHLSVPPSQQANERLSRRNSSRMPSRANSRNHSPDPSHPATSRKTRGTGAAWWLDVQCASTADMRQLRRVSLTPCARFLRASR